MANQSELNEQNTSEQAKFACVDSVEVLGVASFYEFTQNNSGGRFHFDEKAGLTHYVLIQAYSAQEANERAQLAGIYFDGCRKELDCSCCGDRWYELDEYREKTGDPVPSVYGQPVDLEKQVLLREFGYASMPDGKEIAIHYLDGRIQWAGVAKAPKKLPNLDPKRLPG